MPSINHPSKLSNTSDILKTKVVCTIGPKTASKEQLVELVKNGMNVARLNLAHCSHEFAAQVIRDLRSYLEAPGQPLQVAIMVDINGPKVRSGRLADGKPVKLKKGDDFFFVNDNTVLGDATKISTTYTKEFLNIGDVISIDDGLLTFTVVERLENSIRTRVENSGWLGENKGVTFPQRTIDDLPAISPKDKEDILFCIQQGVDMVSVSCMRDVEDVEELRLLLGNSKIKLFAKVENKRGLDNFESILRTSDGIVLDRGYLGTEVALDQVVIAQKNMIARANISGKPILIANQILETMVSNPRPSRSEAADVANAVMDGVDGFVLSSETAVGEFVSEVLDSIRSIALQAEKATNYLEYQAKAMKNVTKPIHVNESIASSSVLAARQTGAKVIVCITEFGGTARMVAKYRPLIPVIAATRVRQTASQLSAHFGLIPYYHEGEETTVVNDSLRFAYELGLVQPGDIAVFTAGQAAGFQEGTTTKMQLVTVPNF
ncbi:pyruvate kinase [Gorgonomyces haynaldii]|nr:pyruvate kinase [Gorgonomyces haynaldii]